MDMLDKVIALLEWDSDENTVEINEMIASSFPNHIIAQKLDSDEEEWGAYLKTFANGDEIIHFDALVFTETKADAVAFLPDYYNEVGLIMKVLEVTRPSFSVGSRKNIFGVNLFHVTMTYKGEEVWHADASLSKALAGTWLLAWVKTDKKAINA